MTEKDQTADDAPPSDLELEWEEIRALKPSQLSRHLTDLGRSANGSPRVLRERLAAAVGAEPPPAPPLTVWQAVSAVKAAIGAVGKDRKVTDGPAKYAYRGIDSILDAAHDAVVDAGLVIVPERSVATYESRTTRSGSPSQWVSLHVCWRIYGPTGDSIAAATIGEAADTSDKATGKAHTAAWKVLLSELFSIPYSAEDHDAERPEAGAPVSRAEQEDRAAALAALRPRVDDLQEQLDNLPPDLYYKAVARMTDRAAKAGAEVGRFSLVDAVGSDDPAVLSSWLDLWEKLLARAWAAAETPATAEADAEDVEA